MEWKKCIAVVLIPAIAIMFSACAIHSSFPFICFRADCVRQQINLKPLEKRLKTKLFALKKKRKAKRQANKNLVKNKIPADNSSNDANDSITSIMGNRITYTRYLILFKLKTDTTRFDSIIVEHTDEYKTIKLSDQNKLDYLLKEIFPKKIIKVYIQQIDNNVEDKTDPSEIRRRNHSIIKYLRQSGIPRRLILMRLAPA